MSRSDGGRQQRIYLYFVLVCAAVISVFPLYWMFVVASNDSAAINDLPPRLAPGSNFLFLASEVFITMVELQWTNTLRAVIVPDAVTAFGVFWMRQLIADTVSDEMIEAASIDGAGSFRIYRTIVLPLIRPGASVLALFAFMRAWNDFLWPLVVLNRIENQTAQVALRQLQNQAYTTDFGVDMAGTVVATAPLLLLFLLLGRQIVSGVMNGALW